MRKGTTFPIVVSPSQSILQNYMYNDLRSRRREGSQKRNASSKSVCACTSLPPAEGSTIASVSHVSSTTNRALKIQSQSTSAHSPCDIVPNALYDVEKCVPRPQKSMLEHQPTQTYNSKIPFRSLSTPSSPTYDLVRHRAAALSAWVSVPAILTLPSQNYLLDLSFLAPSSAISANTRSFD